MNKHNQITLGSLFDGIGGFPYAGSFFGIKPLWASEIMPQAISVTMRHFPDMEHVGDITALDGAKLPPVDIITFGSPCQDLSVAGKRAGLDGERSGLFAEAIRIIDEMRTATNGQYPRYAIWENVPGAISSSFGRDFQAVLEAFTKTKVPIPRSGKWANAGMVRGGGVDLAWCVYNAQYFGVPQRRRRIFLVCDFGGGSAGEILFVAKSLSGYFAARRAQGQKIAAHASGCADGTGAPDCLTPWDTQQSRIFTGGGQAPTLAGADGGGGRNPGGLVFAAFIGDSSASSYGVEYMEEGSPTIKPGLSGTPCLCEPKVAAFLGGASAKARSIGYSEDVSPTLKGEPCGFSSPCICEPAPAIKSCTVLNDQGGDSFNVEKSELSPTLRSETHGNLPIVALGVHVNQAGEIHTADTAYSLATNGNATGRNAPIICENISDVHPSVAGTLCASASGLNRPGGMGSETDLCVAYCLQGNMIGRQDHNGPKGDGINEDISFTLTSTDVAAVAAVDCRNLCETEELSGTLQSKPQGYSLNYQNPVRSGYVVRRLLPVECERLQGYPDGWTESGHDGKEISDTRRYQMLGNSVAVPCVAYILLGVAEQFRKEAD